MNLNFYQQNPKRLHSPLLDGKKEDLKSSPNNKRTYPIFPSEDKEKNNSINLDLINSLETSFKVISIFVLAIGGIVSILELIIIIRTLSGGSFDFGNSLVIFIIAFIATTITIILCLGFAHLIKMTRFIYLALND